MHSYHYGGYETRLGGFYVEGMESSMVFWEGTYLNQTVLT